MIILDNNALNYVVKNKVPLTSTYVITHDVMNEFEIAFDILLPHTIKLPTELDAFDEAVYLKHYQKMLNTYNAASFYNMTGFGDISILSLLHTLKEEACSKLFSFREETLVITSDATLTKHILKEFEDKSNGFDSTLLVVPENKYFQR